MSNIESRINKLIELKLLLGKRVRNDRNNGNYYMRYYTVFSEIINYLKLGEVIDIDEIILYIDRNCIEDLK